MKKKNNRMSDKSPPNRTMPNQMNARAEAEIRE